MLKDGRRIQHILDLLKEHSKLRVAELSRLLGVSEATIRRDLDKLASNGRVQRKHGGAELVLENPPEPPVILRIHENEEAKQRIGRTVAGLVKDGEAVFIGSGTTALQVARYLCGRKELTVITNAQTVAELLAREEGIALVSTGGLLRRSELSFLGHIAIQSLRQLRPQKVIMGIRSISIEAGLTSDYLPEVTTDQAIIESGREVIIVADHSKFNKVSPAFVAPIKSITTLVTDQQTPGEIIAEIRLMGVEVIVC